jgi:hypothetical protein
MPADDGIAVMAELYSIFVGSGIIVSWCDALIGSLFPFALEHAIAIVATMIVAMVLPVLAVGFKCIVVCCLCWYFYLCHLSCIILCGFRFPTLRMNYLF